MEHEEQWSEPAERELRSKFCRRLSRDTWGSTASIEEGFKLGDDMPDAERFRSEAMAQFFNRDPYVPPPPPVAVTKVNDENEDEEEDGEIGGDTAEEVEAADDKDADEPWAVVTTDNVPLPAPVSPFVVPAPVVASASAPAAAAASVPVPVPASSAKHLARHHVVALSVDEERLLESFRQSRGFLVRSATAEPYNRYETEHQRAYTTKEGWGRTTPRDNRHHPVAVFTTMKPTEHAEPSVLRTETAAADDCVLNHTLVHGSPVAAMPPIAPSVSKGITHGAVIAGPAKSAVKVLFNDDVSDAPPPPPPTHKATTAATPAPVVPTPTRPSHTAAPVEPTPTKAAANVRTIPTPRHVVRHASPSRPPASPVTKGSPALAASRGATFETRAFDTTAKTAGAAASAAKKAKEEERAKQGPPRNPAPTLLTRPYPHCVRSKQKMLAGAKEQGLMLARGSDRTRLGTAKTAAIAARKNMAERTSTRIRGDARPTKTTPNEPPVAKVNDTAGALVPAPFARCMGGVHDMLVSAVGTEAIDSAINKKKKALTPTTFGFDGL